MLNHSEQLDRAFGALADATRRAIVERLAQGPATVSEIAGPLSISLPAISHHLRALEHGGLIRSEKVGRVRTCRIEPAALRTVEAWMSARRAHWEHRLDRLETFLRSAKTRKPPTQR
ncbi:MAG: helix-turn-helix transcriptional regulator [Deltaproteobacteria bacterium]|nr:helix-turn-helix transcriptional regulator [Nannocystaceae bacterium]